MNESLFRQESLEKVKNSDETDAYLKVVNPSFWLIVCAGLILAASFAYWGFVGNIPMRTTAVGVIKDGEVTAFMSAEGVEAVGDSLEVLIDGVSYPVTGVKSDLFSAAEIKEAYGEGLNPAEMSFVITADVGDLPDGVKSLFVVTNQIKAFDYMLQVNDNDKSE